MPDITRKNVEEWIKTIATGEFHYKEVFGQGLVDPDSYDRLRRIMHDLCYAEEPVCESVGKRDGFYRPISNHAVALNWQDVECRKDSEVLLPFGLRDYSFIYPDTCIVVAGSKSSGKTGFLYRTVVLNMDFKNVVLLTNLEGGIAMLKDRFTSMDVDIPVPAPFKVINVSENFHDYIKERDTVYVIDYIDCPDGENFYLIGSYISKIDRKLQGLNSVAVIGLQKPANRDIAYGGEQTLKNSTLYIAMDNGILKIKDCKVPTDSSINPNNMCWKFKYQEQGTQFVDIQRHYPVME